MIAIKVHRRVWHPLTLVALMAVWLATFGNWPFWQALWRLPELQGATWPTTLTLGALLLSVNFVFLGLSLFTPWRKLLGVVLLAASATTTYFMLAYRVVIDPTMIANALHTDAREVRDLLSIDMLWPALWGFVLPGVWWWRQDVRPLSWRRAAWQRLLFVAIAIVLTVVAGRLAFQDLASTMRNHKSLRYMINPYNTVYALAQLGVGRAADVSKPLVSVGEDARYTGAGGLAAEEAPLLLVVVGETLLIASMSGIVSAYNAESGEVYFTERLGEGIEMAAAPLVANGLAYFQVVQGGDLIVVKPGKALEIVARNSLGEGAKAETFRAVPVPLGDQLLLRGGSTLYCVGK